MTGAWQHDGHYHVVLRLDSRLAEDELGGFVRVTKAGGATVEATIQVDIEPFGVSRGVLGG